MTDVQVANMALDILGVDRISALTDPTRFAKASASCYPVAADEVFRAYDWPFAIAYARPVASTEEILNDFSYAYTLPATCLVVLSFGDAPFIVAGGLIYSDEGTSTAGTPILKYISSIAVASWPYPFVQLVALYLAYLLADIVGHGEKTSLLKQRYEAALSNIVTRDIPREDEAEPSWTD